MSCNSKLRSPKCQWATSFSGCIANAITVSTSKLIRRCQALNFAYAFSMLGYTAMHRVWYILLATRLACRHSSLSRVEASQSLVLVSYKAVLTCRRL